MSKEVETSLQGITEAPISNGVKPMKDPVTGLFLPGNPGGGRPKGSVSVITKIKQLFEENPKALADFIEGYMNDPANRKHIVEMIDGKPRQSIGLDGGLDENNKPMPILGLVATKNIDKK